jgi:hypothetical protein
MRCTECQEPPRTNSSKNGTQWSGGLGNRRVAEHASVHDFQKSHSVKLVPLIVRLSITWVTNTA